MTSAPVSASKLNFQGLRSPYAQISGRPPPVANGLSGGMEYDALAVGVGSMRSSLPSSVSSDWPLPPDAWPGPTSSAAPPSPVPIQSMPSGPVWRLPPLWFGSGCAIARSSRPAVRSAVPSAFIGYAATRVSPDVLVKSTYSVAPSGEKASPSNPRSPPDAIVSLRSMTGFGSSAPFRMARTRPACSVT